MSIRWFPFNIKDFLANTKRLNTEAKGAYLLLMLDYYEQGGPAPDDDAVLATITELSPEAWERHRRVLEPLFQLRDGFWHHDRMARELLEASSKHARAVLKATHASHARSGTSASKPASSRPQAVSEPKTPRNPQPRQLQDHPEANLQDGPKPIQSTDTSTLSSERVDARALEGSQNDLEGKGIGTFLDRNWSPDLAGQEFARSKGMTSDAIIESELLTFHDRALARSELSYDWAASWRTWCTRYAERQPKQIAPRVEVNNSPSEAKPPSHRTFELALQRWITDQSGWSHQLGPSPGSLGCRVPKELLEQYNIDLVTGLQIHPPERKKASAL